jgi:MFS family permease
VLRERRAVDGIWLAAFVVLGLPTGGLGLVLVVATAGYFVTTSVTGRLVDRMGTDVLLIIASGVVAIGLVTLALAPAWWTALLGAALLGAGSGPLDAGVNAQVAVHRGVRMMGWLHASWGLGAALGPPVVGVASGVFGSWRAAFLAIAFAFGAVSLAALLLRSELRTERPAHRMRRPAGGEISLSLLPFLGLIFLQFGLEAVTGQWPYSQLTARALPGAIAGWGVSLYWGALTAGRVALGLVGHRFKAQALFDGGVALAILGAAAFWILPPLSGALVALPLMGVGLSVLVPLIINQVPARFGPARAAHAIGYLAASGTIGSALLPAATGVALQWFGPGSLGPALTACALTLAGLHFVSRRSHDATNA